MVERAGRRIGESSKRCCLCLITQVDDDKTGVTTALEDPILTLYLLPVTIC